MDSIADALSPNEKCLLKQCVHLRTSRNAYTIKVRWKSSNFLLWLIVTIVLFNAGGVRCNRPPRFLIDGQTEIVLRLKEGDETPVGTLIYKLRGVDPDGDRLHFGVRQQPGSGVIRVESVSASEAAVYLAEELDRETRDEYALVLTLTDGRLGHGNFVTQSLLLLVEDVNDNTPVFKSYQPSVVVREDARPGIIAALEATDADEGAYGQVVYQLRVNEGDERLFSVSTAGGKAMVRLNGALDYEKQVLHQLKVLAVDRAKQGRVNTGTAAILVKVQDVEDQPPQFVRMQPVVRIAEDAPVGSTIVQVTAVDGDRGINNPIEYSLSSNGIDNEEGLFAVEKESGVVVTRNTLDRERLAPNSGAYILQITATEVGSSVTPPPHAVTEITVIVTDVNDEIPQFRSLHYSCQIPENSPINTPLTFHPENRPEVYDYDQGNNGTFHLSILGDDGAFEITPKKAINEASFTIRVKNASLLDFERVKEFNFTLIARETVRGGRSSEVDVTVEVLDRNDNYPEFGKKLYEVTVPENCDVGTTVAWVQAMDEDSGRFGTQGIRYTSIAGSIENLLELDPKSGVITVKKSGGPSWDREQISHHYLTVEARDDLGEGNRNTVQLVINIEDVNDNPPVFIQNHFETKLFENKPDFETPLKVEARDADLNGTKNSDIEYSVFGDLKKNFSIDSMTGVITPRHPLDFEKLGNSSLGNVRAIHLTVRARDWGSPSLFTDAPLLIYVQDVNDHAPEFEKPSYNASVTETLPGGTPVLQVKAIDLDGSTPYNHVVYRILSGASDKFTVDPETGVVLVAKGASLDPDLTHPKKTLYTLRVAAIDGASGRNQLQTTTVVNITILDVNNKKPQIREPDGVVVDENVVVGTEIAEIKATDQDSTAKLRYRLDAGLCEARSERGMVLKQSEYNCSELFRIDGTSGVVSVAKVLDREMAESFRIGVVVEDVNSDTGPQIAKAVLTIDLEDVNDNNPKFRRPYYRFTVAENSKNGVFIGSVIADDSDKNKSVTYNLEGIPEITKLLYLNSDSGDILVASKIDREQYDWLNVTVKARDSGTPPRSSRTEIYIQILDENDNNPYFLADPGTVTVPENAPLGQEIATLEAADADIGEFGKITYLLDRVSSEGKFLLEPDTGVLRLVEELDREERHSYFLVIEAWDNYQYGYNSGESRNAFKHLNVSVLDINDNPPKLHIPPTCITITEFHEPMQSIASITATDADDPHTPNGQLIMDIANGADLSDLFTLTQSEALTAEIRATRSLRGRHGNYTVVVRAQDLGTPSLSTEASLQVCVTDFNDHAPVFVSPPHNSTLRVPENATVGSALVQVIATDGDVGSNGAVRYRLKADPAGHWKTFSLQPVSGVLELRLPLDRDKQKIYDIRIEAYDLGNPTPLSSDLDLTIYITNVNDYQPQFMVDEFAVNFTENAPPKSETFKLPETIDRDELEFEGPFAPICYYIIGGNDRGLFSLDRSSNSLTTNVPLDREETEVHRLIIKATEDCLTPPRNQTHFDPLDDTQLLVVVNVLDVNDNAPRFVKRVFTGGVSTATDFGTKFMHVKAVDADVGVNAEITYHLMGRVKMTLTEGLENLQRQPFLVDARSGAVVLNFDPQEGMKGYFDFMVSVNDTDGLSDVARVFIYLLRADQRVRFVLRQQPPELRNRIDVFREILGNITGHIVNIDEFKIHTNQDGTIDKTRTDLYLHLVNRRDNSILEVEEVLKLVDQNTEKLDSLFKEFNVLDTQPGDVSALRAIENAGTTFWLTACTLFLLMLLLLCLALCVNQRQTYQRKLKAATATAYDSDMDGRGLSGLSGRVPNTNKHSMEGSNPIWLQAYENEWYKNADEFSHNGSENGDSLDENVVSCETTHQCSMVFEQSVEAVRPQNLYQTLPPAVPPRKLETTEL